MRAFRRDLRTCCLIRASAYGARTARRRRMFMSDRLWSHVEVCMSTSPVRSARRAPRKAAPQSTAPPGPVGTNVIAAETEIDRSLASGGVTAKQVLFDAAAREKVLRGTAQLADAVQLT